MSYAKRMLYNKPHHHTIHLSFYNVTWHKLLQLVHTKIERFQSDVTNGKWVRYRDFSYYRICKKYFNSFDIYMQFLILSARRTLIHNSFKTHNATPRLSFYNVSGYQLFNSSIQKSRDFILIIHILIGNQFDISKWNLSQNSIWMLLYKQMNTWFFIKKKQTAICRQLVSIEWPRSYEPRALTTAPCRLIFATFYVQLDMSVGEFRSHDLGLSALRHRPARFHCATTDKTVLQCLYAPLR